MKILWSITLLIIVSITSLRAQRDVDMGIELQVYPTGIIPGISLEKKISTFDQWYIRLGANIFDHRGLGVQEEEQGYGIGFSLGYKRSFSVDGSKWKIGLKNDFWWNQVKWRKPSVQTEGDTKITVIQPTLEIGYVINKGNFRIVPSIAAGYEINVITEGEPTGEGAIILIGIALVR